MAGSHFGGGDLDGEDRDARGLAIDAHFENRERRPLPVEQTAQRRPPSLDILLRRWCRQRRCKPRTRRLNLQVQVLDNVFGLFGEETPIETD